MSTLSATQGHPLLMLRARHFHVVDTLRALLHLASSERIYYPPSLNSLLEDAAMAREMYRL